MGSPASTAEETGGSTRALIERQWQSVGEWVGPGCQLTGISVVLDSLFVLKRKVRARKQWPIGMEK